MAGLAGHGVDIYSEKNMQRLLLQRYKGNVVLSQVPGRKATSYAFKIPVPKYCQTSGTPNDRQMLMKRVVVSSLLQLN